MRIMLDRGHYTGMAEGFDPGAISRDGALHEAAVCHVIGWQVATTFSGRYPGTAVHLFKPSLSLWDRIRQFNDAQRGGNPDRYDAIVSLHMNAHDSGASGVEVCCYDQKRLPVAAAMSEAAALTLGLPDRGGKVRRDLFILRETKAPAYLIELGFITNPHDIDEVLDLGTMAIIAALDELRGHMSNV